MKTLITTLGTGNYKITNYHVNGIYAKQTCLGFKALAELLEIPQENFFIFGTEKREGTGQLRASDWSILTEEFENPFQKHQLISVPYGLDKKEHYEFFEKVLSTIDYTDEIIFDISHGFRSTPVIFLMSLFFKFSLGYSSTQKLRVFYGAFEAGEETDEEVIVSNSYSYKIRNVALVEMEIISELLAWVKATERFAKFGIASDLAELAATDKSISYTKYKLEELDKSIAYNSLEAIADASINLNNSINSNRSSISPSHPFYYISDKVNTIFETFDKETVSDQQLSAAQFYLRTQRYGQAAIAVKEYLISLLTEASGDFTPKEIQKISFRLPAQNLVGLLTKENLKSDLDKSRHEELRLLISEWDRTFYDEITKSMKSLPTIRNMFAHAKKHTTDEINSFHKKLILIIESAPDWARVKEAPVHSWFELIKTWYSKKK